MRRETVKAWLSSRPWKRGLAGAIAALFLLPVPALGLTFLTPWVFTQSQLRAPPFRTSTGDLPRGDFLQLDMGANLKWRSATSSITATRVFRITNPTEAVTFAQDLQALMRGSNLNVSVQVRKLNGTGLQLELPPIHERTGIRLLRLARRSSFNTLLLTGGDYSVTVRVTYRKNRLGLWDSTASDSGSPYRLTITGI